MTNYWLNEEIRKEIKKKNETNENGNTKYQNLWNIAKAAQRGKFIVVNANIKKQKDVQQTT